jgi:hypothetical protein
MQLTRFDRWLRKRFVYETHIYTMRHPGEVPRGITEKPLPPQQGRRFDYFFVSRDEAAANAFIASLKAHSQMFATRVEDRKEWYTPIIAPEGKSFTWKCVWIVVGFTGAITVGRTIKGFLSNPEVQKNLLDALNVFKG